MRLLPSLATALCLGSSAAVAQTITVDTTVMVNPDTRVEVHTLQGGGHPPTIRVTRQVDSAWANRATLGMTLRITGSKRDTLGLFVTSVVPDGPAERAGVVEGDRIAYIDDTDLRVNAADLDDAYVANVSIHRLSRRVTKLTAGAKVQLRVYSGGKPKNVTVTAEKMSTVFKGRPQPMRWGQFQEMTDDIGPDVAMVTGAIDGDLIGQAMGDVMVSVPNVAEMLDDVEPNITVLGDEANEVGAALEGIQLQLQAIPNISDVLTAKLATPRVLKLSETSKSKINRNSRILHQPVHVMPSFRLQDGTAVQLQPDSDGTELAF